MSGVGGLERGGFRRWPMYSRFTVTCVVLVAALVGSAGGACAIECLSEKGAGYPWAWRQIDGKQCWYKGKPGMDKTLLRWTVAEIASSPPSGRTPSVLIENSVERDRLLHSFWPPLPPVDVFGERFEAVRGQRP